MPVAALSQPVLSLSCQPSWQELGSAFGFDRGRSPAAIQSDSTVVVRITCARGPFLICHSFALLGGSPCCRYRLYVLGRRHRELLITLAALEVITDQVLRGLPYRPW